MYPEISANRPSSKYVRIGAIVFAMVMGLIILGLKYYAAKVANSAALRSDALEGTVNVVAAVFGLGAILFSEKPADKEHPYGHGKIEYFSQGLEGGLISLAGFLIFMDATLRILHPVPIDDLGLGLKINIIAGILNGLVGLTIYGVGKKYKSEILKADGVHLLTDLMTTCFMAGGLILVLFTGWTWLDPIIALGVALFLFRTGFTMIRASANALLDAENPKLLEEIVAHLNEIDRESIITIHELKVQEFGRDKHIDMHVVVPEYITIKEAHDLSDRFAQKIHLRLGKDSMVHTHIDPCEQLYCSECMIKECPIRQRPFEKQLPFNRERSTQADRHSF